MTAGLRVSRKKKINHRGTHLAGGSHSSAGKAYGGSAEAKASLYLEKELQLWKLSFKEGATLEKAEGASPVQMLAWSFPSDGFSDVPKLSIYEI